MGERKRVAPHVLTAGDVCKHHGHALFCDTQGRTNQGARTASQGRSDPDGRNPIQGQQLHHRKERPKAYIQNAAWKDTCMAGTGKSRIRRRRRLFFF